MIWWRFRWSLSPSSRVLDFVCQTAGRRWCCRWERCTRLYHVCLFLFLFSCPLPFLPPFLLALIPVFLRVLHLTCPFCCYTPHPQPRNEISREGGSRRPCVCLSMCMCPDFVQTISPEHFSLLQPNLLWCCIIMRWSVLRKNWFGIFKIKFTSRAYMIKIWLFTLYLLDLWSICNQTSFKWYTTISQSICE